MSLIYKICNYIILIRKLEIIYIQCIKIYFRTVLIKFNYSTGIKIRMYFLFIRDIVFRKDGYYEYF